MLKLTRRQLCAQEAQQAQMLASMAIAFHRMNQHDASKPETCYEAEQLLEHAITALRASQYGAPTSP